MGWLHRPTGLFLDDPARAYRRNGFYPIMHVLAVKPEVLDEHPEVAMRLVDTFERAKEIAFHYYDDPNWSHLAWTAHLLKDRVSRHCTSQAAPSCTVFDGAG